MSDIVIHARDLTKIYRLYSKPAHRFLDMFGMLRDRPGRYTEHSALDHVSLEIPRGEKVAIIGRNGAGKSTFLKLVTGVIEPTSGVIEVKGTVHALLQIGTGFHPDFTGRENIYAYLAQLGVTGADADRRCAEIIEFAELEEYVDQPVKTYSTGMSVRLMFSTSTAITPDLLVLDEVLGVGDAYFAHKSYERMKDLCDSSGTTLLLVTHDIYSAIRLCTRVIWIDHGRVLMDGDGPTVVKAYEDSIRQQEEARLRVRKQERLAVTKTPAKRRLGPSHAIVEIQSAVNRLLPAPVYFSRIQLIAGDRRETLPLDAGAFDESRSSHLQREGPAWGEAAEWQARGARAWLNYGSPFHKVAGVVPVAPAMWDENGARVEIDYSSAEAFRAVIKMFAGDQVFDFGTLEGRADGWQTWVSAPAALTEAALHSEVNVTGVYGTGAISVDTIEVRDAAGEITHFFKHGDPFELRLAFRVNQPDLLERPQVLVAFHRDGALDVCRVITRDLTVDASQAREGEILLRIPALRLANGTYTVTVMIARERYYDDEPTQYFSLNPGVYACHSRALEIVVFGGDAVASGTVFVENGEWSIRVERIASQDAGTTTSEQHDG